MTIRQTRHLCRIVRRILAAQLAITLVGAPLYAAQASQEVINAQADARASELAHRVDALRQSVENLDARLRDVETTRAVLVSDMTEVKWLARSAAIAVLGQLVLAGMRRREQNRTDAEDER